MIEYAYALRSPGNDGEVLAYHYHPHVSASDFPHLHLGAALLKEPALAGMHLPTGWVGLDQVILLTLRDLGVAPLRPDYAAVLTECSVMLAETRGVK